MTDIDARLAAALEECAKLREDRDRWKAHCFAARKRRDEWEEKAKRYCDALLTLNARQGGPADDGVGRAWLADLGATGGD